MIEYHKDLKLERLCYLDNNNNLKKEIWRGVVGYESLYKVSDLGRILSVSFNGKNFPGILKQYQNKDGYLQVDCGNKTLAVHIIVAMAFLRHVPCGHEIEVDHKNEIKIDNRLCNLQVITHRENVLRSAKSHSKLGGVYWNKKECKWTSQICINSKRIHLIITNNEELAAEYYRIASTIIDKYDGNNSKFRKLIKSILIKRHHVFYF